MNRAALNAAARLALNLATLGLLTTGLLKLSEAIFAYTDEFYLGLGLFAVGCYLTGVATPTRRRKNRPTRTDEGTQP